MKCLFVFEGGAGAIMPLVPLTHALRGAGHEVLAAAYPGAVPVLQRAGIPTVPAPRRAPGEYRDIPHQGSLDGDLEERALALGAMGAHIAADTRTELLALASRWRPDLIVGGPLAYAAPLLSADLQVPYVAVEFGHAEPLNWHLATLAELTRLGYDTLPEPARTFILTPEVLRHGADDPFMRYIEGEPMRFLPYSPVRQVEPWMTARGSRPRVCVSAGSRVSGEYGLDHLTDLIDAAAALDVELLIAAPDELAARTGPLPKNTRMGWMPYDVLGPTCDLAVHHAGGSTTLCFAASGVPQVIVPSTCEFEGYVSPLSGTGAVKVLPADGYTPADIVSACTDVLADPSFRGAAERLRAQLNAAPTPHAVVGRLEDAAAAAVGA
ncbi:nucleotide disphospho-sugar-binding domain-containing protein [Streptomyces sp. NPDC059002]|uniref:nucleotide disphospho-sugar-binding domain-containing protein n=1 Tax=Streptomyces sp. NPDC059002 TaxID=3346690 RepID=UPI00367463AF